MQNMRCFLIKAEKKISKSAGNVFTPQVWFNYGSPQSLLLLMLKRFVGTRALAVSDIPVYMNELDYLEDVYFDKKNVGEKEAIRLKGLFKYCYLMAPPTKPSIHVPYNLLAFIVKLAPKDCLTTYVTEMLQSYGYLKKDQELDEDLLQRINYAANWIRDFEEIKETTVELTVEEKKAVSDLVNKLQTVADDPEKIQNSIFNAAKDNGVKPGALFRKLYQVLMGASQGPRLGPYVLAMGKQNVVDALQRSLKNN